jgi:hypothetical protein
MTHFSLVMRAAGSIQHEYLLADYVTRYIGSVYARGNPANGEFAGPKTCIGKVRAYRLNVELAAERHVRLADVCEGHSERLYRLYLRLYQPRHYGFRHAITGQFLVVSSDLLYLDTIILDPRWRGLKLGLLVARRVVTLLGSGCGLVATTIAPYRRGLKVPDDWVPRYASDDDRQRARERLCDYFSAVGFRRIGASEFYGMSAAEPVPGHADLLRTNRSKPDQQAWQ